MISLNASHLNNVNALRNTARGWMIGGIPLPDFSTGHMKTNTSSKISDADFDADFKEAIKELARKDAAAERLLKSLVARLRTMIMQRRQNMGILQHSALFNNRDIGDNFINIRDASGNKIAIYSKGSGWSYVPTTAENSRTHEFLAIYNAAWRAARAEL